MKKLSLSILTFFLIQTVHAQLSAHLMRFPDVSSSHITFVFGDDIWIVEKSGGTAIRLSSPSGGEYLPKFSPDGTQIAFSANYEGNTDVYVMPVEGGIPKRLTYHGLSENVLDWTPDGQSVLFTSSRESGKQRFSQFYTVSVAGGPPEKLAIPYGEFGSFSPDGTKLAYTDKSRTGRTWKRYRGGMAPDIFTFDLTTNSAERVIENDANDELPMWHSNTIYFLSDRGSENRANIWKYDIASKATTQLTNFTDFDVHFPSIGPSEIVFQAGEDIYLMDLGTEDYSPVDIAVITDQKALMPVFKNVSSMLQGATISPDGNRVVAQARGELFTLPAKEGYVANISQTSGAMERSPSWSPDGRYVACWSDASGEYQLMLYDMAGTTGPKTIGEFESGYRYEIFWSPDSRKVAFIDQAMKIQVMDIATGTVTNADSGQRMTHGGLSGFGVSWSPDSKWITYARESSMVTNAIYVFNTESKQHHQLTSGFYNDGNPVFSKDGKYLFYTTNRDFSPTYSDVDNTFIYSNSSFIAVGTLQNTTESLMAVKNDAVKVQDEEKETEEPEEKKSKKKKNDKEEEGDTKDKKIDVVIDVDGFEERIELLDLPAGNYGNLGAGDKKLFYVHYPNSGAEESAMSDIKFYDFEGRESKLVLNGAGNFILSEKGDKMLVFRRGELGVIPASENSKFDDRVPTNEMTMYVKPREEWRQIFADAWRLERDYFYDPNMHGVDWDAMKERYGALVDQANSRSDVNFILGELIGELNASHTYRGGGDTENENRMNVGYLGADFKVTDGKYVIEKVIKGAPWDVEARSPFVKPGVKISEGDYILAINGEKVTADKPISAWLQGLADTPVSLMVNSTGSMTGAREVVVEPMSSELRLRHLEWIEGNRKRVEEATDGQIGYVYVPSTGLDGQNELFRQFYAQLDKKGLIIDERFNNGGQIPDRFIELLDRKPLAFWAIRDGKDWNWPPAANFGPKVMLINGFSGSGGDAFPDYFKKAGLGPLIGDRTWGGLIGISGVPSLIDGGSVTVPTFRMYDPDGTWFKEGYGVDPDIKVYQDFTKLAEGTDVQLEAAIDEVMRLLNNSFTKPSRPAYETR